MTRTLVTAMLALALAAPAQAQTAAEILKLADDAANCYKDLTIDTTMLIFEPGQASPREFKLTSISRPNGRRLVLFSAPGDIKGMGMLTENRDTMYVYLPGFQKIRRMGTHVKNQGFMGSDVTYEDMAEMRYGDIWSPKLSATEDKAWILELTPQPGKQSDYAKIKMWIDKTAKLPTRLEFYDASGKKVKTQIRSNLQLDQGSTTHYSPTLIEFIDHRRNDHKTHLINSNMRADTNVPDDTFTQRSLLRGH